MTYPDAGSAQQQPQQQTTEATPTSRSRTALARSTSEQHGVLSPLAAARHLTPLHSARRVSHASFLSQHSPAHSTAVRSPAAFLSRTTPTPTPQRKRAAAVSRFSTPSRTSTKQQQRTTAGMHERDEDETADWHGNDDNMQATYYEQEEQREHQEEEEDDDDEDENGDNSMLDSLGADADEDEDEDQQQNGTPLRSSSIPQRLERESATPVQQVSFSPIRLRSGKLAPRTPFTRPTPASQSQSRHSMRLRDHD